MPACHLRHLCGTKSLKTPGEVTFLLRLTVVKAAHGDGAVICLPCPSAELQSANVGMCDVDIGSL